MTFLSESSFILLGWFDISEEHNTNVYVTGLPTDITEEEFETTMKKCGLLMFDPRRRKPKLKLYKDKDGNVKGDGLCCYIKVSAVFSNKIEN